VASFYLEPASGRAEVATRVRLAGTQPVTVIAAFSDGTFRITRTEVLVTSAACLDESL
jgi:sulfur-oxidizing protein SoxY